MARESDLHGFTCGKFTVKAGGTSAMLFEPIARQTATIIKYASGGSCELIGIPVGATFTGTSLSSLQGTGYLFSGGEALSFDGPIRFYLMATNADAVVYIVRGMSSPGGNPAEGGP